MALAGTALRDDAITLQPPGLKGIVCRECERRSFLQRPICPHCGTDAVGDIELSGRGRVVSWTIVRQAPKHLRTPYTLVTVDLEDGVRILGAATGDVEIGSPVDVELYVLRNDDDGNPLWWYRFRSEDQ
jgi:uncharacterized OB-fold protein